MARRKLEEVVEEQNEVQVENREVLPQRARWYGGYYGGVLLLVLGIYFLLLNFGFISFDLGKLWPVLLIVPGLYILFGGKRKE